MHYSSNVSRMKFENGGTKEQLVLKTGLALVEEELGLSMKEATVKEVIGATTAVLKSFQEKANGNDGVLEMSDLSAVEEVSSIRRVYEPLADAQEAYRKLISRLKDVPIPDLIANDNNIQQKNVAA